jgi:hypothetical protein
VGDGRRTKFSFDVWLKDAPLEIRFPSYFWFGTNHFSYVRDNYDVLTYSFEHNLPIWFWKNYMDLWERLQDMVQHIFLSIISCL